MGTVTPSDHGVNETHDLMQRILPGPAAGRTAAPSSALQAANERLLRLRAAHRSAAPAQQGCAVLPAATTWSPLTAAQRQLEARRVREGTRAPSTSTVAGAAWPPVTPQIGQTNPSSEPSQTTVLVEHIKVYPGMAVGMLRQGLEAPGRVYWLLRALDREGRGWLPIDEVRRKLCDKSSSWQICGWRRLRQLLAQGQGVLWQRDGADRIWLYGAARAAESVGIFKLAGRPVLIPISALLGGIQCVRAHFYASFHGGRPIESNPISRATLSAYTGVPERTQRLYDRITGTERRRNIAVGPYATNQNRHEQAWQRGRSCFEFYDHRGLQGAPGRTYVAWNLPNSYRSSHRHGAKGRQKKINRQLSDLVNKRARGNGHAVVDRVFWSSGAEAVKAAASGTACDAYWPRLMRVGVRASLWGTLSMQ